MIFSRRKTYLKEQLLLLPDLFDSLHVDLVLFTGDASTTGRKDELNEASSFCKLFEEKGIKTLAIPGNHDHYTRKDYRRKTFYDYFQNPKESPFTLKKDGVEVGRIDDHWWYIALDTVVATPVYSSQGLFSEKVEESMKKALREIPEDVQILMLNHFPFFQFDNPRKALKKGMALHDHLKRDPRIQLYVHGHTHRHCLADLRVDELPVILDSGSTAHKKRGSFNLFDLGEKNLDLQIFKIKNSKWEPVGKTHFQWL